MKVARYRRRKGRDLNTRATLARDVVEDSTPGLLALPSSTWEFDAKL